MIVSGTKDQIENILVKSKIISADIIAHNLSVYSKYNGSIDIWDIRRNSWASSVENLEGYGILSLYTYPFYINHIQSYDPQTHSPCVLWFEGTLSEKDIRRLSEEHDVPSFVINLVLKQILKYRAPSGISGAFSGVFYDDNSLYVFRSQTGSLFIDKDMAVSSFEFEGSKPVIANKVMRMDFNDNSLHVVANFETVGWV